MAKKILFVHGTGVRKTGYDDSICKIRSRLSGEGLDVEVVECRWGESHGIAGESCLSVPRYGDTGGKLGLAEADYMWNVLLHDAAVEMQQLLLSKRKSAPAGEDDREKLRQRHLLLGAKPPLCCVEDALEDLLPAALSEVQMDYKIYLQDAEGILETPDLGRVLARATVARLFRLAAKLGRPVPNFDRRYTAINALVSEIVGETRGMMGFALKSFAPFLTPFLVSYRGMLTDLARNELGDILRYQAQGNEIRAFIADRLRSLANHDVVILAHSLGGVASLETLIESNFSNVKTFVTFGSQAPLLYELGALTTLPARHPLPEQVPDWLNFYDLNDPLSYLAGYLFPGKAEDIQINSGSDFLGAHSAYLDSDRMWTIIFEKLK